MNCLLASARGGTPAGLVRLVERDLLQSRSMIGYRSRRLGILLAPRLGAGLLPQQLGAMNALPRNRVVFDATWRHLTRFLDGKERERLERASARLDKQPVVAFDALNELFVRHKEQVIEWAASLPEGGTPFTEILLFDHQDWSTVLASSLEVAFLAPNSHALRTRVAQFAAAETRVEIASGRTSGRQAIHQIDSAGGLLPLADSFGVGNEPEDHPEEFASLCAALSRWHARLGSSVGLVRGDIP